MTELIPSLDLSTLPRREELVLAAEANTRRINQDAPWIAGAGSMAEEIGHQKGSLKAKYIRLRKLGDQIADAIAPHSACQKSCSQCCHIAVAINEVEADIIAEASKRKRAPAPASIPEGAVDKYFREPCPFLKNNSCSIYDARPIVCRLHFSISDTNAMCDTRIPPNMSSTINLNLNQFWYGYMSVMHVSNMADIRHFFPPN